MPFHRPADSIKPVNVPYISSSNSNYKAYKENAISINSTILISQSLGDTHALSTSEVTTAPLKVQLMVLYKSVYYYYYYVVIIINN